MIEEKKPKFKPKETLIIGCRFRKVGVYLFATIIRQALGNDGQPKVDEHVYLLSQYFFSKYPNLIGGEIFLDKYDEYVKRSLLAKQQFPNSYLLMRKWLVFKEVIEISHMQQEAIMIEIGRWLQQTSLKDNRVLNDMRQQGWVLREL